MFHHPCIGLGLGTAFNVKIWNDGYVPGLGICGPYQPITCLTLGHPVPSLHFTFNVMVVVHLWFLAIDSHLMVVMYPHLSLTYAMQSSLHSLIWFCVDELFLAIEISVTPAIFILL